MTSTYTVLYTLDYIPDTTLMKNINLEQTLLYVGQHDQHDGMYCHCTCIDEYSELNLCTVHDAGCLKLPHCVGALPFCSDVLILCERWSSPWSPLSVSHNSLLKVMSTDAHEQHIPSCACAHASQRSGALLFNVGRHLVSYAPVTKLNI